MKTALLALIVIAAGLVVLSGVWVAVSLVAAVFQTERSDLSAADSAGREGDARAEDGP